MSTRVERIKSFSFLPILLLLSGVAPGQNSPPSRPPVGIPADALHFKGKWYRVYLEKVGWKRAKERCVIVGGQLASVPDSATQAFIKELAAELPLWLGATDEKTEGFWQWINGTRMSYKEWDSGQSNNAPREHYLMIGRNGLWNDAFEGEPNVIGYICEWQRK